MQWNFWKTYFHELFKFFEDKNLLSVHQSGFRPVDSCIYQLLAVTHYIFSNFDCSPTLESHFMLWFMFATKILKVSWQGNTLNWLVKNLRNCYCVSPTLYEISFICKTVHLNSNLFVKLPQFWPCLLLLTVMPSTIFEIISQVFLILIIIFRLIFFL